MSNPQLTMSLDDAVTEVLGLLFGLELAYDPDYDRYRAIARTLNRATRANALESEWSWYTGVHQVGFAVKDTADVVLPDTMRPRMVGDDAVRLVDENDVIVRWAYFLPRDALHKHADCNLYVSSVRQTLIFSRPFTEAEDGLSIQCPVMREPTMFELPRAQEDPSLPYNEFDQTVRDQQIDFGYPDLIVARAAFMYAQTDPVLQPRVPTLEAGYKDLMYQALERDGRNTVSTYLNPVIVPVESGINPRVVDRNHPHAFNRDWW